MGLKKTATLKLMISEELNKKLHQLAISFEVDKSVLVRSLLWEIEKIIGEANRNDIDIEYSIELKNGKERLLRKIIEKEV